MRDTNTAAPHITRIEAYYPSDDTTNTAAYLAGRATCEACDGEGSYEAHVLSHRNVSIECGECEGGTVGVELEGDKAEAAYQAWATCNDDTYSISAFDAGGECAHVTVKGWLAFVPVAQAFSAQHKGRGRILLAVNNDTYEGEPGGNLASWQDELIAAPVAAGKAVAA